ncbi:hypothetical protein F4703DRAFT_1272114 [Phycomyces blakesleeanus]|uniref:EamA domain-containing protein n=1 Tax=Phycomyces blakesleeanus (strain ATCC 8743b / DSM 1359 / FGSC 10004 / NBRC 33097 / NRRL 1555) TaxID=763407 RepID=A0A167PTB8_PHYB8|nr:hypothetical protein PHYBLDRAFT_154395 [Phycomyces blakesleeanus NRRL 1555(-)]OAD78504.1 hypothetical protein PHYBLDRAFT_154395 [Phycomyces blakesleeanus NRRL 1555(-)]|eukprot:XP_018296544.1 hypothetical protein PHYBLDRAFT_154395 [Phycomyces blakesleeanus NRRL 1555(-)]
MTSYHAVPINDRSESPASFKTKSRSVIATVMLTICIVSFVLQTELAQYVQQTTDYQKPYFILYVSHSCYIFMIPIQFLAECIGRGWPTKPSAALGHVIETAGHCKNELAQSLLELQGRVKGENTTNRLSIRFIISTGLWLAILLTLPAYLWYVSVNLTSMSNLTAIYNTGCFFAYVFSVWLLHDRLMATKIAAILLCMIGVFLMAFWTPGDQPAQSQTLGISVAVLGAALYGFYEVYYKKYASPSQASVLFANTVTGAIGIITLLILWIPLPVLHFSGYETFELPDLETFVYILGIASMSVVYNATFMCVIALVNPVFAAVGVMLTVPAVAVTDVLVTGVMVPGSTLVGSILILIGFYILNRQVKNETEEIDIS